MVQQLQAHRKQTTVLIQGLRRIRGKLQKRAVAKEATTKTIASSPLAAAPVPSPSASTSSCSSQGDDRGGRSGSDAGDAVSAATSPPVVQRVVQRGLHKKFPLSDTLCTFLDKPAGTEMARTEVTKYLHAYIKQHQLQQGSFVTPDDSLRTLFDRNEVGDSSSDGAGQTDRIHFMQVQRYMTPHFKYNTTSRAKSSSGTSNAASNAASSTTKKVGGRARARPRARPRAPRAMTTVLGQKKQKQAQTASTDVR